LSVFLVFVRRFTRRTTVLATHRWFFTQNSVAAKRDLLPHALSLHATSVLLLVHLFRG
jgi:hypothetical protein